MPVEVRDLSHVYNEDSPFSAAALKGVSLTIADGEFLAVIGHTGSGKSTLIQHLNGLIRPTGGTVVVDGMDIADKGTNLREVRRRVGLVFQYPEYQLFEETVHKDIAFGPKNLGLDNDEIERRVEEACRLGDAGAVEVAVERHEREALRLGRERANVCLPLVARVAPSAAQRDSQERQVHLLVRGDEGQACLEHPPDPVARGAL